MFLCISDANCITHNLTDFPFCFVLQEMQSKMDALRRELDDQRDKDGGVFISEEKRSEFEEKIAQLDKLRKEHANLTVSHDWGISLT